MSIFTVDAIPPTPAQKTAKRIKQLANMQYLRLLDVHQELFQLFWATADAEPQAICDELGPEGKKFFLLATKLVELLLTCDPAGMTPDQYTPKQPVTVNSDDTITLG
jgi:hypothetical protein